MRCKLKGHPTQAKQIEAFLNKPDVSFELDDDSPQSPLSQRRARRAILNRAKLGYEINVEIPGNQVMRRLKEAQAAGLRLRPPGFPKSLAASDKRAVRMAFSNHLQRSSHLELASPFA